MYRSSILLWAGLTACGACASSSASEPAVAPTSAALAPAPESAPAPAEPPKSAPAPVEPAPVADAAPVVSASAPASVDPAPPKPEPEPEPEPEPSWPLPREGKHRVLIVGDSLAATDFGGALRTILDAQPHLSARRRSKSSTGFARPDFFNWMKEAPRLMKRHDPDLVVAIIGGNDGQDLIKPSGQGKRVHWRKDGWEAAYAERVRAFADVLASTPRARVLWLSLPTMDLKSFERKLTIIRRVQQEALADHPEVELVDTSKWFLDDGKIVRQIKLGKKTYALRQEDGVHFSRAGGRWFAERVAPLVLERLPPPEPKVDPADPGPPPRTP